MLHFFATPLQFPRHNAVLQVPEANHTDEAITMRYPFGLTATTGTLPSSPNARTDVELRMVGCSTSSVILVEGSEILCRSNGEIRYFGALRLSEEPLTAEGL
jgi:hypothetical protein